MKVIAKRAGWDGLQRRVEGETFDWPSDKKLGSWMEAVGTDKATRDANSQAEKEAERAAAAKLQREQIGHVGTQGKTAEQLATEAAGKGGEGEKK
jgi:hypothetical protein